MTILRSTAAVVIVVSMVACGGPAAVEESTVEPAASATLGTTTLAVAPTLGVTPEEFVETWNRQLGVHEFMQIAVPDIDDGAMLVGQLAENSRLELTVDPQSGQLTEASFYGTTDSHTDMQIVQFLAFITLVDASNAALDLDILEDFVSVSEQIGLPNPENEPEGFGSGSYTSEGEIDGVVYIFEESGSDLVLTARPAP